MADTNAGRGAQGASQGPAVPSHWQHKRVLLVDDHRAYRLLIGAFLHTLGLAHEAVGDGVQALQALAAPSVDLVISDCRLPIMAGYAMTAELRRRDAQCGARRLPVVALTGCLGPEQIQRCLACGMDDWLVKPITLEQLRQVALYWLPGPGTLARRSLLLAGTLRTSGRLPTRVSLIATFGFWEAVEPLLFCLIQEAHDDLAALVQARKNRDAELTAQLLHRLIGSIAFLGSTDLEPRALQLIEQVERVGVLTSCQALERFDHDVERYLQYLANL